MPYYWSPNDPLIKEIFATGHTPVKVTMEAAEWLGIVAMLQVALRHPSMDSPPFKESEPVAAARRFIAAAKENLGQLSEIYRIVIERGDDPANDAPFQ